MTLLKFIETEMLKDHSFWNEKFQSPPKEIGIGSPLRISAKRIENYLINLDDIIGTYHQSYQDKDFKTVCKCLIKNRGSNFEEFDVDDDNFLKSLSGKKDLNKYSGWGIFIYKGKGYIDNGNHRTVSAKLLAKCGKIANKIYVPLAFIAD